MCQATENVESKIAKGAIFNFDFDHDVEEFSCGYITNSEFRRHTGLDWTGLAENLFRTKQHRLDGTVLQPSLVFFVTIFSYNLYCYCYRLIDSMVYSQFT